MGGGGGVRLEQRLTPERFGGVQKDSEERRRRLRRTASAKHLGVESIESSPSAGFNSVGPCLSAALFPYQPRPPPLRIPFATGQPLPPPEAMPVGLPPYSIVDATGPKSRRARQNENRVPGLAGSPRCCRRFSMPVLPIRLSVDR